MMRDKDPANHREADGQDFQTITNAILPCADRMFVGTSRAPVHVQDTRSEHAAYDEVRNSRGWR
ncbi:hypothetical protein [Bradyrhizobium cajani]|uniref:hypothetical protein n=1 Tax=Bradyrhizobium cajani TaxID=1928661 RepID=UPI0020B21714|nr:hypothetical protein [Bradyrhizobium cajani]